MFTDKIIDLYNGDERSKAELKRAYQKAFKFKCVLFTVLTVIAFPWAYHFFSGITIQVNGTNDLAWSLPMSLGFGIGVPAIISLIVGNFAMHWFTRHLKISLPDTLAPKIEIR